MLLLYVICYCYCWYCYCVIVGIVIVGIVIVGIVIVIVIIIFCSYPVFTGKPLQRSNRFWSVERILPC